MYRSASACLMSTSGNNAPCPVCRKAIRDTLVEKKTGVDQADPWALVVDKKGRIHVIDTENHRVQRIKF